MLKPFQFSLSLYLVLSLPLSHPVSFITRTHTHTHTLYLTQSISPLSRLNSHILMSLRINRPSSEGKLSTGDSARSLLC